MSSLVKEMPIFSSYENNYGISEKDVYEYQI